METVPGIAPLHSSEIAAGQEQEEEDSKQG